MRSRKTKQRPTSEPASARSETIAKAVSATTGKKIRPPSQAIKHKSMRKRSQDTPILCGEAGEKRQRGGILKKLAAS
jgi:hypothetical protein